MSLRLRRLPAPVRWLFPGALFALPAASGALALTFDDGPTPALTPWILDCLAEHGAAATHFCVGANVARYPRLFRRMLDEGHRVGNHTQRHDHFARVPRARYEASVAEAATLIPGPLFRPPYGRLSPRAARRLQTAGFRVVFWSLLTYDFDARLPPAKAWQGVAETLRAGDVIVLHDNAKARANLQYLLPRILRWGADGGLRWAVL